MKVEFIHLDKKETNNPEYITNVMKIYHDYDLEKIYITTYNGTCYEYPRLSFYRMEIY